MAIHAPNQYHHPIGPHNIRGPAAVSIAVTASDDVTFEEDAIFMQGITLGEGAGTALVVGGESDPILGDFDVIIASPVEEIFVPWWVDGNIIRVGDPAVSAEFNWIGVRIP